MAVSLPEEFVRRSAQSDAWGAWRAGLPRLIADVLREWELRDDGPLRTGQNAVVVPVLTSSGERAAAKFGFPHREAEFEHLALREWAGRGTVRLLRADPRRSVLLLERAEPGHDLHTLPVLDACRVIAGSYANLHTAPLPQLDRLSSLAGRWSRELGSLRNTQLVPRRFVDQAIGLAADLSSDPGTDTFLIHGDLHFENVLAAQREPWLVIDPKPLAGDPAYEVAPVLWNRWAEAVASGDVRAALLDRMFTVVDRAELDEDRVRDWIVVREVVNVAWAIRDGVAVRDSSWVSAAVTIMKAVQR